MKRDKIEHEWFKRRKVLVAAVRLKYALLAEDELNDLVEEEQKKFYQLVAKGKLPAALPPKSTV